MEEIIAKTAKTLYIICYVIFLVFGFIILGLGCLILSLIKELGIIFFVLGAVCIIASLVYLIYFIKMPKVAIKLKDGRLYFMKGIECSPTEVETFQSKCMGLDGALFGFGKLLLSVRGKQIKLKYIVDADNVTKKLLMLKAEYQIKENIASKQNAEINQTATGEENIQEEK